MSQCPHDGPRSGNTASARLARANAIVLGEHRARHALRLRVALRARLRRARSRSPLRSAVERRARCRLRGLELGERRLAVADACVRISTMRCADLRRSSRSSLVDHALRLLELRRRRGGFARRRHAARARAGFVRTAAGAASTRAATSRWRVSSAVGRSARLLELRAARRRAPSPARRVCGAQRRRAASRARRSRGRRLARRAARLTSGCTSPPMSGRRSSEAAIG